MKENILSIRRLVDRAEQLGQKLQEQSHKLVLCHSDIHGGNVLLAGNDNIYIVDWDDPIMAPYENMTHFTPSLSYLRSHALPPVSSILNCILYRLA